MGPGVYDHHYADLGIACRHIPDFPKGKPVQRFWSNPLVLGHAALQLCTARPLVREHARDIRERFDLVHFNLDSTFLYARALRPLVSVAFVAHMRTTTYPHLFFRWQARVMSRTMDEFIFITENEERDFRRLGGTGPGRVIYNIVEPPAVKVMPHQDIPQDGRFRVACLSNFAYARGVDRLVEVAEFFAERGRRDVLFVVAGAMRLSGRLPGQLGELAKQGASLEEYARLRGVADMFLFLGHVAEPERVLAACHALVKPTRGDNPWGRDILEAMSFGLPVISIGTYDRFVENGETGVLLNSYSASDMAQALLGLAENREKCARLGHGAALRVRELCTGHGRAAELLAAWREAVGRKASS
jgi:glycosyltransferase involved in cell wall biosynthesis